MNRKLEIGAGIAVLGILLAGCGAKKSSHTTKSAKSHSSSVKKTNVKTLSELPKAFQKKYTGKLGKLSITETIKGRRLIFQKNRGNRKVARGAIKITKINKSGNRYGVVGSFKGKTVKVWLKPKAKGAIRFNQKALKANFVGKPVVTKMSRAQAKRMKHVNQKNQKPGMSNRNVKKNSQAIKRAAKKHSKRNNG